MKISTVLSLAVLLALVSLPVQAQDAEPPLPPPPLPGKYVLDELDWLTDEQEATMNSIIYELDQDGVAEIAVVTLDDCGSDRLAFRRSLFDTWGIGHANDNDGLLILVCWYGGDPSRRSVEQLYGRGLNGALKPGRTDNIAEQNFVPAFQDGRPGDGLARMVRRYNDLLRYSADPIKPSNPSVGLSTYMDEGIMIPVVLLLIAGALLILHKILPRSVRNRIENWTRSGTDDHWRERSGFDDRDSDRGGSSDGGGGSSTRF
jgi:uncharacterized membrane protein YgcG